MIVKTIKEHTNGYGKDFVKEKGVIYEILSSEAAAQLIKAKLVKEVKEDAEKPDAKTSAADGAKN